MSVLFPVYLPNKVSFMRGDGVHLYDANGKKYVDFCSGIGVNSLGYGNPVIEEAINKVVKSGVLHVSNLFVIPQAIELAEKLVECTFADNVFFCNSGAEAVECALKVARVYQRGLGNNRFKFLSFHDSFHGRTWATCSANGPKKRSDVLEPYVDWFVHAKFNDISDVIAKLDDNNNEIGAIIVEPIQGEGGVKVASGDFLRDLRKVCDERDIVLIADCVQCGIGRSGRFFVYEHHGIVPDLCAIAKGMGGGVPIGACLAKSKFMNHLRVGMHGSTYGSNPLTTTVSLAVVSKILSTDFMENVARVGNYLNRKLCDLARKYPDIIVEVRGMGLMIGVEVSTKVHNIRQLMEDICNSGLILVTAGVSTLRILPPLVITEASVDEGIEILDTCIGRI